MNDGAKDRAIRCINVVNFIRGVEPRFATDLMLPVRKQMECILEHKLPATWLLQFDALVAGEFVDYLRAHMAPDHEVGFWFEMNEKHCAAAGVEWRGRPGYEWDHLPPVAFTIGYTPDERIRLADAAMREFHSIWGKYPDSVASWNLDSITMAHLVDHYKVKAFAVCRDQIATDGFTIWGAPIAGYYPSKENCWSPAKDPKHQINAPVFRMLGQDPVRYYNREYRLPGGKVISEPDTMEPVWTSGRSPVFVKNFLEMITTSPSVKFAYAQMGQENSFPWPDQAEGYLMQMKALAQLRDEGSVHVETMSESGRRFKKAFATTPAQAQIMLHDPLGDIDPAERTLWYQSRFYRANLHFQGDLPFLRDLTVYDDRNAQPFLKEATRQNDVEQRMPAVLDGYHWRKSETGREPGAGGFFLIDGKRARLAGKPTVGYIDSSLTVEMPIDGHQTIRVRFYEDSIAISVGDGVIALSFEWEPSKSAFRELDGNQAQYRWQGFDYSIEVDRGTAEATPEGWMVSRQGGEIALNFG
jgi:hypothetical protein